MTDKTLVEGGPMRRDRQWSTWRNINPIGRFLSRFDINSPKGLLPIVAALVLGALLLLGVQASIGVFDNEKSSLSNTSTDQAYANGVTDAPPPLAAEPVQPPTETIPTVTVILGEDKFAKITGSMFTNLFCLNPSPVGEVCDPVEHQRILRQVLNSKQLAFLRDKGIDDTFGDWGFVPTTSAATLTLPTDKPTQLVDEQDGTVILINP